MMPIHSANSDVRVIFPLEDGQGNPIDPDGIVSIFSLVKNSSGSVIEGPTLIAFNADDKEVSVLVKAELHTPEENKVRVGRTVEIEIASDDYDSLILSSSYIAEKTDTLLKGINSFAPYLELAMIAREAIHLDELTLATDQQAQAALINAWHNIGNLRLLIPQADGVITNSKDLTRELIDQQEDNVINRLMLAQCIEANGLLGGNPIEDRRRMGLISESAGESTHFFRTTKPLQLPVYRATIDALSGLVDYAVRINRQ